MSKGEKSLKFNRAAALALRLITLCACGAGLYPMFFGASFSPMSMSYFTVQSNLLIFALFAVLAVGTGAQIRKKGARGEVFALAPWLQGAVVFYIQITFLVFAFVLAQMIFSMGGGMGYSNFLLHYVAPLLALLDWILFAPHGLLRVKHAALWLAYPAAYVVFSFIRAELGPTFFNGSRFPYFFMDADLQGLKLFWIAPIFFGAFFALGCAFVAADRALAKKKR